MTSGLRQGGGDPANHPTPAPLSRSAYEQTYYCGYCDRVFVVPSMARHCESKHELLDDLP